MAAEEGLFVGRPSTSRLELRPRKSRSRRNNRPATAGIPRASSVPLLSEDHMTLEVHSTPLSLATRSLADHVATRLPSRARDHAHQRPAERQRGRFTGRRGRVAAQFSRASGKAAKRETALSPNLDTMSHFVSEREERVREASNGTSYNQLPTPRPEEEAPIIKTSSEGEASIVRVSSEGDAPNIKASSESEATVVEVSLEATPEREREKRTEVAAQRIQRWYRRHCRERERVRVAEVKSLLREKRHELNQSLRGEQNLSLRDEKEKEERKRRRRQEKMAASRQVAILSLQRKREEKKVEAERIAQREIALLQESGKIKRREKEKGQRKKKKEILEETKATPTTEKHTPPKDDPPAVSEPQVVLSPVHTTPPPDARPASTYADILDTLRLLEEAPPPLVGSKTPPTDQKPANSTQTARLSVNVVGVAKDLGPAPSSLSESSKLQNILSYLDEMERADEDKTSSNRTTAPDSEREGSGRVGEELEAAASDVTSTILSQRLEIDNKNKTVEMLQKALGQQRELTVYHAREMEKEGERRLELQRQEYETTIQRHQTFIDQLIEDKKKLGERCEKLVKELKESSTKYQAKVKTLEETHAAELTKVRQVAAAADKLKREKWRAEESHRIKEATVRSLEPEIQRIIHKGKADIHRLKSKHEAELLEADERAAKRFVAQMEEVRTQCALEKEAACAYERELARERYEKLAEQEEMNSQQQRRRLFAELEQEREKMAAQWNLQRQQLEHQQVETQEAHAREVEELKREHCQAMAEAERRHGSQMRAVEERVATERTAWQENFTRRQESTFLAREREMRESLRQERDKEIEMVISRLEAEAETTRNQNEKAAEAKIKRIRERCEAELSEVERSERGMQEKLTEAKRELGEREGEVARLRSLLRQKEEEVRQVGEVAERLTRERDNVTDVVRQEFADRLVSTEEENRRIKLEMSELTARQKLELERAQREKERDMEEVHSRVRQALEKKEGHMTDLRTQHTAALRRAEHLEMLLERQRKELLKK